MTLLRFNLFNEPQQQVRKFDSIINEYLTSDFNKKSFATPSSDIWEDDKNYMIEVELPGLKKDEIKVQVEDRTLTIKTEKQNETEKERRMIRQERLVSNYVRSFRFREDANFAKIEADFENGVLTLNIPKIVEEKQKERIIKVK